jgi:hypothetical protein
MRKFNATEPMRHADIVNTDRLGDTEFRSSFMPSEAASAVSEFGQDEPPQALTVTPWMRVKRALRAWWIGRMTP